MTTPEQVAAAQTFLTTCGPANALLRRPAGQSRRAWNDQLQAAQATRSAARAAMQDLCGTHTVYKEAIAAAQAGRKLG